MTDEPAEIVEALEEIRQEKHPDISSKVVKDLVQAEYETLENREESLNRVSSIVESYLEKSNT